MELNDCVIDVANVKSKRRDERVPLLVYLQPELVKSLKTLALQQDTHVYLLVEKMVASELGRNDGGAIE